MTDILASVSGVLLSLAFSYIPGLHEKFNALETIYKRLVIMGLLLIVAAGLFGMSCAGIVEFAAGAVCDRAGLVELLRALFLAFVANQATYAFVKPKPQPTGPFFAKVRRADDPDPYNNFPA